MTSIDIDIGYATDIGGREANADSVTVEQTPLGTGAAVVDGIGSTDAVCRAARRAADTAAIVAAHRDAQAGFLAAAETMPNYDRAPNAVAATVSVAPDGRIEIAHCGDAAVHTWSAKYGLTRWTTDQVLSEWIGHALRSSSPTATGRAAITAFADAEPALANFVLTGLKFATISTMSWTPLRSPHHRPDLVILTSDGVHKAIHDDELLATIVEEQRGGGAQHLADNLVKAGISAPRLDEDEAVDNASAAVLAIEWEA